MPQEQIRTVDVLVIGWGLVGTWACPTDALLATNRRLIDSLADDHDRGHDAAPAAHGSMKTVIAENAIEAVDGSG